MPLGYEKIRDALIRKGMDEADAKETAAKIWNKHHKGSEAVGAHYDKKEKNMSVFDSAEKMVQAEGGGIFLGIPREERRVELGLGLKPINPRRVLEKTGRSFLYQHNLPDVGKKLSGLEHVAEEGEHQVFKVGESQFKIHKRETPEKLEELYKQAGGRGSLKGSAGRSFLGGLEDRRERVELGADFTKAMATLRSRLSRQGAEGIEKREARLTKKLGVDKFKKKDSQYRTALNQPVPTHPPNPSY